MHILMAVLFASATAVPAAPLTSESLRSAAHDYYEWQKREFPVDTSDQGDHTWDDQLTDYSPAAIGRREATVRDLLARVRATDTSRWSKDDRIDWILFRCQLEWREFESRVRQSEETDP